MLMLFFLLALNLGISCWDAYAAGLIWRQSSGWMRTIAVAALAMSLCGFFQFAAIVLGFFAVSAHWIGQDALKAMLALAYLLAIVPIIGAGLLIMIDSWRQAIRSRSLLDGSAAIYNTVAMVHNASEAFRAAPGLIETVGSFFDDDSDENAAAEAVVLLLLVAAFVIAGGTTFTFFQMGKRHAARVATA